MKLYRLRLSLLFASCVLLLLVACGGAAEPAPEPVAPTDEPAPPPPTDEPPPPTDEPPPPTDEPTEEPEPMMEMPAADGAALTEYVLNTNPYLSWGTWPADEWNDFTVNLVSGAPHGSVVRIYVNDIALEAADSFDGEMPVGSIIVKENYVGTDPADPGELDALTVMYKTEDFNPDAGNWYWLKVKPDGSTIDAEGAVAGCIGCHSQDNNQDFILRYGFGSEPAVTSLGEAAGGEDEEMGGEEGGATDITLDVATVDLAFEPTAWSVPVGSNVAVNFTNEGALRHAWAVVKAGEDLGGTYTEEQADSLFFTTPILDGGTDGTFNFTAPDEAGTYLVICTVPGHFPAGMQAELEVTP